MEHRALPIKKWIIKELTADAWSQVIRNALPALTFYNSEFSVFDITKNTYWDLTEIKIIQHYLEEGYQTKIPEEVIKDQKSNWFQVF